IAAVQALYGAREPDAFDAAAPDDTLATAALLPHDNASPGSSLLAGDGDLTTFSDVDWYRVKIPCGSHGATVQLQIGGLSLLAARIAVLESAGHVLAPAAGEAGSDLDLHLDGLRSGSSYFIKVERATDDVFAVGSYRLEVLPDPDPHNPGGGPAHQPG